MKQTQYGYAITLFIFYMIIIVWVIFIVSQGGWKNLLAISIIMTLILVDYQTKRELPEPIKKKPVFLVPADNIFGTFEEKWPIHAGRVCVKVSFPKRFVRALQYHREGGLIGIFSHLSGRVQYTFELDERLLKQSTDVNCLAPEGGYVYLGSLTGREVVGEYQELKRENITLKSRVVEMQNLYEDAINRCNAITLNSQMDGKQAIKDMTIAMRNMSEAFTPKSVREVNGGKYGN